MKRTTRFEPHSVVHEWRADGSLLLQSTKQLGSVVNTSSDWLRKWSSESPSRVFIAERSGAGWREESYIATLEKVRAIAQSHEERLLKAFTPEEAALLKRGLKRLAGA